MKEFDVAIIGAGVSGASVAWQLSKYRLKTALLEKCADVGFGVSKANSGIVHGGFHHSKSTLKARLELQGNLMFEQLQYQLDFPFKRNGILVVAFSEEEMETVRVLFRQGKANGVRNLELCGRDRLLQLEPKLSPDVVGGFYVPNGGTIEPYRYVFALVEGAKKGGVELFTNFKVAESEREGEYWQIKSADGETIRARYVVNAAGLYADEVSKIFGAEEFTITPRKGEEYLLDRTSAAYPSKVVFPVPVKHSKGVLVIPTVDGTTMVGPTAEIVGDKEDHSTTAENRSAVFRQARRMVPAVSERDLITGFSGSRPVMEGNDFYIAFSKKAENLIQAAGIQSPGLTASPAIAGYICGLLRENGVRLEEKAQFASMLEPPVQIRRQSAEEADRLHKEDPAWTNIICRCEKISEAEIVDAIRHGHTTLDGIKFYTRAGMGRCQGGFCSYKILKIIARETGMSLEEATKRGGNTGFISGHLGDMGKRG